MPAKAHYILGLSGCLTVVIISNTWNNTSYWMSKSKKLGKPHGPRPSNCTFCTGFNLLTSIFLLPYIIMDLPIFVIAEWATLLVDIRCPRGGS